MARANTLVFLTLTILAFVLLGLWYALGFKAVDPPLDVVVTVIWLLVILACCFFLVREETRRRRAVRTLYLVDSKIINAERGVVSFEGSNNVTGALAEILDSLTYSMGKPVVELDDDLAERVKYVVKSDRFEKSGKTWEGEVVMVATHQVKPFSSRSELARIIIPPRRPKRL